MNRGDRSWRLRCRPSASRARGPGSIPMGPSSTKSALALKISVGSNLDFRPGTIRANESRVGFYEGSQAQSCDYGATRLGNKPPMTDQTSSSTPPGQSSEPTSRFAWSRLNHLQVGRYAEYVVKMEFTLLGMSVFGSEVDDRGIDLVVRTDKGNHYDVQVKSVRSPVYIFFPKTNFEPGPNLLAALVPFAENREPDLYLVPSEVWLEPNKLFVGNDYGEGLKSKPEWGINLSRRNMPLLEQYQFHTIARSL